MKVLEMVGELPKCDTRDVKVSKCFWKNCAQPSCHKPSTYLFKNADSVKGNKTKLNKMS